MLTPAPTDAKPGALIDLFSSEAATAVVAALFSSLLVSAFPRTDIPLVPNKMALVLGSSACPHSHQCNGSSIPSLRLIEHCGEERQEEDLVSLCQPIRNKKEKALQSGEGNNRSRHAVCRESRERLAPAAVASQQLLTAPCLLRSVSRSHSRMWGLRSGLKTWKSFTIYYK